MTVLVREHRGLLFGAQQHHVWAHPAFEFGVTRAGRVVWPNCTLRQVQASNRVEAEALRRRFADDDDDDDDVISQLDAEFMGALVATGAALFKLLHGEVLAELEAPTIEASWHERSREV